MWLRSGAFAVGAMDIGAGAGDLGHLLAQQLLAAGEHAVDVQPKLGSRVRLLSSGIGGPAPPQRGRHAIKLLPGVIGLLIWARFHDRRQTLFCNGLPRSRPHGFRTAKTTQTAPVQDAVSERPSAAGTSLPWPLSRSVT
jgi:hypothetical protein